MLEKMKSFFNLQNVVSYIEEDTKLKLFKYNKKFQNMIGINIINYKYYKGFYTIKEKDDYYNEFDYNGELIFTGKYLNGKRHGLGKEFDYTKGIKFEGQFVNGKRNGKGKEYDIR